MAKSKRRVFTKDYLASVFNYYQVTYSAEV